jgi:hypothetical protein
MRTRATRRADERRAQAGELDIRQDVVHHGLHLPVADAARQPQARAGP